MEISDVTENEESKKISQESVILITFLGVRGIVHTEFLPESDDQSASLPGYPQCAKRDKSCGRTNHGCFIMTMHLFTTPWVSDSLGLRGTSPYKNNLSIPLIFPKKRDLQGDPFWRREGHQESRKDKTERPPRRILPTVHRSVVENDGKVY